MELELDDGLFWLPTEFLNDDDDDDENMFSGKNSDLSSPVESVFGTESDEEDYLNDLSRKLAQSTLEEENRHIKPTNVMAGSPQSTLCGYNGITNTRNSPAKAQKYEFSLDPLRIAAGEVARLGMAEPKKVENYQFHFQQIHAAQLKQQQLMKQQQQLMKQQQYQHQQQLVQQNMGRNGGGVNMKPMAAPLSAWPNLQQYQPPPPPPGTGMRAVFLGNPNLKRESIGTGVFLPRQIGAPTETRKQKGCSTVLLPDKVIHALNVNLEAQTRSNGPHFPNNYYDAEMRYRKNVLTAEQRRQEVVKDLRLPQEWTY